MADDITTLLKFVGDPSSAQAAISGLVASLQTAAQQSVSLGDIGTASGNQLAASFQRVAAATTGAVQSQAKLAAEAAKAESQMLALARATAQSQAKQGGLAEAQETLRNALARVSGESVAAIRTQSQLAGVQAQIVGAAQKAENAMLREAQAIARLQQASGNTPGAIKTLTDALEKAGNPKGLAATRVELQKTYLDTNYQNSPLISAIKDINQGLGLLRPVIGGNVSALQSLTGIAGQAASSLGGVGAAGGVTAGSMVAIGAGIGVVVAALGALVAAGAATVSALQSIGEEGLQVNAQMENVRNGIATVIASVAEIRNSDGVQLKGVDALNAALPVAADQLRKLRIDALETSATFADIAPAFQAAIGPGLAAGLNIDQIRENTIKLTQAVTALGLPYDQIKQETRAILSGEINRNTQAAQALGITREAVKEAQKQGKFAEFLEEKLQGAAAAGKLVAQSFTAAQSNLKEAAQTFSGVVTEGLFDQLKGSLNNILPQIFDKNQANLISQNFSGIADTLTRIFDTAGKGAADAISLIFDGIKAVSAFLDRNKETVAEIIEEIDQVIRLVVGTGVELVKIVAGAADTGQELNVVASFLKAIVVLVGIIGDTVKVLASLFATVGSTIKLVVVAPLEVAVKLLAALLSGIPFAGAAADNAARALESARKSATSGIVESGKNLASTITNFGQSSAKAIDAITEARKRAQAGQRAVPGVDRQSPTATGATFKAPKQPPEKTKGATTSAGDLAAFGQAQLKELQIQEKQAELSNKRIADALKASLQDRLISLETFTALSIQTDRELLDSKLRTIEQEKIIVNQTAENEEAAINKTAKNRQIAAEKIKVAEEKKNAKLAELQLKADQAQQEADLKAEAQRDDLRRTQEKAEEDHQRRLVEIREVGRKQAERQIKDAASVGVLGAVAAEQQLIEIERQRVNDREALLRRDLANAKENQQERERINDELIKLEAERAAASDEAAQRIRNATLRELDARVSLLRNLVTTYQDLRRAQIDQQATQTTLAAQTGQISGRDARVQELQQQKEIADLEHQRREQSIKDQADALKRQAELAGASKDTLLAIEREKNEALRVERQRGADEQAIIDNQLLALIQSTSGGIRGLFSARVNELANSMGLARGLVANFVKDLQDSITPLDEIGSKAFKGFAEGIGQAVSNFVLLGKTGPAVIRKILAEQLAAISKEATVNAIKELALGFATLFLNPAASAGHFTSAGLWAALAGASALVGRAIAPKESGGAGGNNQNQQNDTGNRVIEQGGPVPRQADNNITIRVITHPDVTVERVHDAITNNSPLRSTIQDVARTTS